MPARLATIVHLPDALRPQRPTHTIVPVMAHPVFADADVRAAARHLRRAARPQPHLIPKNTISLLETNRDFIEAYMVGLNHEIARELLCNEFPTDLRPELLPPVLGRRPTSSSATASRTPAEIEELARHRAAPHVGAGLGARHAREPAAADRREPGEASAGARDQGATC